MQGERPALLFISASSPTGALIDRGEMFKLKIPGTEERGRRGILRPAVLHQQLTAPGPAARSGAERRERLPQRPGCGAGPGSRGEDRSRPSHPLPQGFAPNLELRGNLPSLPWAGAERRAPRSAPGEGGRRPAEARSFLPPPKPRVGNEHYTALCSVERKVYSQK